MNFAELVTEFYARGTDYLSEDAAGVARAERWINQAYQEILSFQSWPFLKSHVVGAAGAGTASPSGLRRIRFVTNVDGVSDPESFPGKPLGRISLDDVVADGNDPSLSGTPEYYYVTNTNTVASYPLGGTIRVDYFKRVSPMTGTDSPLFDAQYHDLIVDRAMIKAYKDSDNFEAARELKEEYAAGLQGMTEDYQLESRDVQYIEPSGSDS